MWGWEGLYGRPRVGWLDASVNAYGALPTAEQSAKDRIKTTLRQSFSSAPGRKHPNQNQQEEEHNHSSGHIREDQV